MFKKFRHITKEEFESGEYGICGEIYVEKFDWGGAIAIGVVLVAMGLTLLVLIKIS